MTERGAVAAKAVEDWVADAAPGAELVYAWGSDFPRGAPGVVASKRAFAAGLVTLTSRRSAGGRDYIMQRLAARLQRAKRGGGYATHETPDAIVLLRLRRAAAAGAPCPTNAELGRAAGVSEAEASYIVRKHRDSGTIAVECFGPGKRRCVTIRSSGARTAMERPR